MREYIKGTLIQKLIEALNATLWTAEVWCNEKEDIVFLEKVREYKELINKARKFYEKA